VPGPFDKKEIILGVTGSVAAYKACDLASRLVEAGARVTCALTRSARELVGPASFEAITGNRCIRDMFESIPDPEIEHITLAQRADLFIVAPATANILAKAAHGIADDWISTTLLATRAPVLFAPAMNTQMYTHPATRANLEVLRGRGCGIVGPASGKLACGDVGPGRLAPTSTILESASVLLCKNKELQGKHVLITSGANHEPIDPVRFIGNRSSGKMGRALALEALRRGARVTVVSGPAQAPLPAEAEVIRVETAHDMLDAVTARFPQTDVFIAAAAVADYRLENPAEKKHKRNGENLEITLHPNPDIAAHIGLQKEKHQVCIGFAAETHDLIQNAKVKLLKKNLDFIVANEVGTPDSGFGADTVRAWFLLPDATTEALPLYSKEELAEQVLKKVADIMAAWD
jgi:phosphopantothenoylcysteine decarboxylase/phosphopantothenate--cysteine ligase